MRERLNQIFTIFILVLVFIVVPFMVSQGSQESANDYSSHIMSFEAANDTEGLSFTQIQQEGSLEYSTFQNFRVPYSYSVSDTWIRIKLNTEGLDLENDLYSFVFDNPNTDYIDGYLPVNSNGTTVYEKVEKGLMRSLNDQEISNHKWNVMLPKNINQNEYIYMLVKSNVDIDIHLQSIFKSIRVADRMNLFFGIFFGVLLALVIGGLLAYLAIGRGYYMYYVLFVLSTLLYQMRIHCYLSYFFVVPYVVYMRLLWVFVLFMFLFPMLFTTRFLDTKKHCPKVDLTLKVVFTTAVVTAFLGVLGFYKLADSIMHYVQVLCPFIIIVAAAIRLKQGFKPARFFMAGWISITLSSLIWSMAVLLPAEVPTQYILQLGFVVESMLILVAFTVEIRHVLVEQERLKFLSSKDGMTNFYNKRVLVEKVEELLRGENKFSLILIDIDNFKEINDVLGHLEGDNIIIRIAELIQDSIRPDDIPCRYGGDEMLIILPNTTEQETLLIAESIRQRIEQEYLKGLKEDVTVSISIGVAEHIKGESYKAMVHRVDQALYRAKKTGKNRTVAGVS